MKPCLYKCDGSQSVVTSLACARACCEVLRRITSCGINSLVAVSDNPAF